MYMLRIITLPMGFLFVDWESPYEPIGTTANLVHRYAIIFL